MVAILLLDIVISNKLVSLPLLHQKHTIGILIYPFVYLILDTISENYGYRNARISIYMTALSLLFIAALLKLVFFITGHDNQTYQLLKYIPWGIVVNVVSIVAADLVTALIFSLLKSYSNNSHLWFRSIFSNGVGQLIYMSVGYPLFYGLIALSSNDVARLFNSYLFIFFYCCLLVPVLYLLTFIIRKFSRNNSMNIQTE